MTPWRGSPTGSPPPSPPRGAPPPRLGDLNAWRRCKATRALEDELAFHGDPFPPSFPAARPVLALDRIYSRGVRILEVGAHARAAARGAPEQPPLEGGVRAPPP